MADEITDAEIAELRRLHEAATPGPWERKWSGVVGAGGDGICTNGRGGNNHEWIAEGNLCMDLIAAMHSALPGLLARLEQAERERDEARASNARLNRRAQEAEAAAERVRKIEARIAARNTRKPLPRIEAAFALAAAEDRIATLEAALRVTLRELKTWRDTASVEEWGGVALRLTNEAIGVARTALREGEATDAAE